MSKKATVSGEEYMESVLATLDLNKLQQALGTRIPYELLRLALTHRSFANENGFLPNNERLEFLGDAVLGLSVASQLYDQYPSRPESDISKMRASMVSRYGLADVAREIGLGPFILLGRGEVLNGGSDKDSILADTTEALFGAIYIAHGFETAREVILRLFKEKIDNATSAGRHLDWKTTLQELCAQHKLRLPVYEFTSTGPEHEQVFTVHAYVNGTLLGTGVGTKKKLAEAEAAQQACEALRQNPRLGSQLAQGGAPEGSA
ncbi:ribonuclease III [Corynebacterium lizhenjunii]|uniref:Ribonuclease 3 n=1 Tax=Corynebacterium lizhenjunii TaxID=2709394 RepID=A0A7T0PBE4_9CORY|nr:ribonuclease III [Corynebacterium lizhenjunii]QPK78452.1 ribonuclease III [Corynebacterium lizhenjunii]